MWCCITQDNQDSELTVAASHVLPQGIDIGNLEDRPEFIYPDGSSYVGQWNGSKREGTGIQVWKDGERYAGGWMADQFHGNGRFEHQNGDFYEGEFDTGAAHGKGTYQQIGGAKYVGEWQQDQKHGFGEEAWPDGTRYSGYYVRGEKSGYGELLWADGPGSRARHDPMLWFMAEFVLASTRGDRCFPWSSLSCLSLCAWRALWCRAGHVCKQHTCQCWSQKASCGRRALSFSAWKQR
ncbi:PIP5K9 [Symbiodinium necroappetens]|uniref:PIP5K9 protein n=1 Tax=Symbiodinium necroappetens TaxID=1628268 RepID=A0A812Z6Y4_9DINO|nr:PIP5K9 [Symbiodinium necroappetens]